MLTLRAQTHHALIAFLNLNERSRNKPALQWNMRRRGLLVLRN